MRISTQDFETDIQGVYYMKAMVIGAAGFVGSYLVEAIHESFSCSVIATKLCHETFHCTNTDVVDLDILDYPSVCNMLRIQKPDYIFHLAAQSSVARSWEDPALTVDINIKGAINVLNAIRTLDYSPQILLVGSGEEYGYIQNGDMPLNEKSNLYPKNIYAATKACQNMIAKIYADAYNLRIILVRAFNHIGPRQAPTFVIANFCKQVALIEKGIQEPVLRVGNLNAKRDFTDVRDVVKAYVALIRHGKTGETYNVGSGHAVAIKSILTLILSQSSAEIQIETDTAKLRPMDVPVIEADISKIMHTTGWRPQISMEKTIHDTLEYWRGQI